MTRDTMNKAIDLDRIIRNFSNIKEEMNKGHWVRIETPSYGDIRLGCFYDDFAEWIDQKLEEAKKLFEEL